MSLSHAQLNVADVAANKAFFETYFGFRCVADRGEMLAVLADKDSVLALSHFPKAARFHYPQDILSFHIGIDQESRERVNEIHASLTAGGFEPDRARDAHGAWTFYVKAPEGFFVEVFHRNEAPVE